MKKSKKEDLVLVWEGSKKKSPYIPPKIEAVNKKPKRRVLN